MITGLKPFINIVNMMIFLLWLRRHKGMLRRLDAFDSDFVEAFGRQNGADAMKRNVLVFATTVGTGMVVDGRDDDGWEG